MFELLTSVDAWIALLTLTVLEIVLGIDNIIFLSLVANKLPAPRRPAARRIGLSLALVLRIIFLSSIAWIISLSQPVLTLWGIDLSWRDIVFFAGGLFLLTKSTREIHEHGRGRGAHGDRRGRHDALGDRPDRAVRHRVLDRLGGHRRRHGRASRRS